MDTPDFGAIGTDAHSLFNLINDQMNTVTFEDPRWQELHDMFRLAAVVCSLASQACTRQAERDQADEPVPYTLSPLGMIPDRSAYGWHTGVYS